MVKRSNKRVLEGWLLFRLDCQVKEGSVDAYMILDLKPDLILSHQLTLGHGLTEAEARDLLKTAHDKSKSWPPQMLFVKGEVSKEKFLKALETNEISYKEVTAKEVEPYLQEAKESFGDYFFSPTASMPKFLRDDVSSDERESAIAYVQDAYHECACASGKKFKFCCKPIFQLILGAMHEAERGSLKQALAFLEEAKKVVGETPEILCRYSVVYSFSDRAKSDDYLRRCLKANSKHPRANYLLGIGLKEKGDLKGAVGAYERAVENYPVTDKYHLNEVLTNLGCVHYDLGDFEKAKAVWERALVLLPSDVVTRKNLLEFIYSNPVVPESIRIMSPFIEKFFDR